MQMFNLRRLFYFLFFLSEQIILLFKNFKFCKRNISYKLEKSFGHLLGNIIVIKYNNNAKDVNEWDPQNLHSYDAQWNSSRLIKYIRV